MIPFAPLLEPPFQVGVRQSSQTGNFSDAISIGAMTSNAGNNIGIRESVLIYRSSCGRERPVSVIGGFRG
jgi:hypothetical protein